MSTAVASLIFDLVAKTGDFITDFKRAEKQAAESSAKIANSLDSLKSGFSRIAQVAAGVGLAAFAKSAIDAADKVDEASKKLGVSAEGFGSLAFAFAQSGSSGAELEKVLARVNRLAGEAADGSAAAAKKFADLGVSFRDGNGIKSADKILLSIVEEISKIPNAAQRAAAGVEILGKSGANLGEIFANGREELERLQKAGVDSGAVFSDEEVKIAAEFKDAVAQLTTQAQKLALALLKDALPALLTVLETAIKLSQAFANSSAFQLFSETVGDAARVFGDFAAGIEAFFNDGFAAIGPAISGANREFAAFAARADEAAKALERVQELTRRAESLNVTLNIGTAPIVAATDINKLLEKRLDLEKKIARDDGIKSRAASVAFFNSQLELVNARLKQLGSTDTSSTLDKGFSGLIAKAQELQKAVEAAAKAGNFEQASKLREELTAAKARFVELGGSAVDFANALKPAPVVLKEAAKAAEFVRSVLSPTASRDELEQRFQQLRDKIEPLRVSTRQYKADLELLAEAERKLGIGSEFATRLRNLLTSANKEATKAAKENATASSATITSLDEEIKLLKLQREGRVGAIRQLELERKVREELQRAGAAEGSIDAERIRAQVTEVFNLTSRSDFSLTQEIVNAIQAGVESGSVATAFKTLADSFSKQFGDGLNGALRAAVAVGNELLPIFEAVRNSDGNAVGDGLRALNDQLTKVPGEVGAIAQALAFVDTIAGGRLFGTGFTNTGGAQAFNFSSSGFSGQTETQQERQRSLFRGRSFRTLTEQLSGDAARSLQEFFDAVAEAVAQTVRAFNTRTPQLVSGTFRAEFDKDGKLVKEISTVLGVAYNEGIEAFRSRVLGENLLAVLAQDLPEVNQLAARYRATGELVLDGARLIIQAQSDIAAGTPLLGESLTEVADLIEKLQAPGESLANAYTRVAAATRVVSELVTSLGVTFDGTRAAFVEFSAALIESIGGLDQASELFARVIAGVFDEAEQRAIRLNNARNTAQQIAAQLNNVDLSDIQARVRDVFAGVFDPATAALILRYAAAQSELNAIVNEGLEAILAQARAAQDLAEFVGSLDDDTLTNYQRGLQEIDRQYKENIQRINDLARSAGEAAPGVEQLNAAFERAGRDRARLLADLELSTLRALESLYGSANGEGLAELGSELDFLQNRFRAVTTTTVNWAESIKALEKIQAASNLAVQLRDLFSGLGISFAEGVQRFGVPLDKLLKDLGLSFSNLTSPQSVAAFASATRLLGLTAQQLADLAGIDLTALTAEQRQLVIDAVNAANKPTGPQDVNDPETRTSIDNLGKQQALDNAAIIAELRAIATATRENADAIRRLQLA